MPTDKLEALLCAENHKDEWMHRRNEWFGGRTAAERNTRPGHMAGFIVYMWIDAEINGKVWRLNSQIDGGLRGWCREC